MDEKIEPVLSPEEWARVAKDDVRVVLAFPSENAEAPDERIMVTSEWAPDLIALANHGLADDDPRKITREWIALLYKAAKFGDIDGADFSALKSVAEALESYLPPRE